MANDPQYFTFLSETPYKLDMVLGAARVSLANATNQTYDIVVPDAFS